MDDLKLEDFKRIDRNSSDVDKYSELRMQRYSVHGVLPVEFFPLYQRLRSRDSSRCILRHGDIVCVMKKIRIYSAQYNRLEGFPISLFGERDEELRFTETLLRQSWIHKIRSCFEESSYYLAALPWTEGLFKSEREGKIANFWVDVRARVAHMSKSTWRGRSVLNYANKNGGLEWRLVESSDYVDLNEFYQAWLRRKKDDGQGVMYKELYEGVLSATRGDADPGLFSYVLKYAGTTIAFVSYIITGGCAHLIVNQSIPMTDLDFSSFEKVAYYSGKLSYYFTMKTFEERGINTAFLGYGDDPKDPLNDYKRAHSDGQTELLLVDTGNKQAVVEEKKDEVVGGFF